MAALIIPSRRVWQPQGKAQIDRNSQIGHGLREALVPSGSHLFYAELGRPLRFAGVINPVVISGQFGTGVQNAGLSNTQEYIGAISIASDATLAVVGRVPSIASNSTAAQVGQTAGGGQLRISIGDGTTAGVVRADAYIGGGTRVFGGSFTLPVGSDYIAIARHKNGVLQDLWVNGIQDPATLSQTGNFIGLGFFGRQGALTGTPLFLAATWQRALSDQEIRDFSLNPWQIFRPVQRRIYFDMGAGGSTDITLLGTNGTQSNIAALDTIVQSHYLISASDKQDTTGSIGPVTLSQSLSVTSSESKNTTSSGTVYQTHALLATQANQKNVGAGGSVILEQTFSAQSTSSATTSTASAISQIHALVGQATTQSNVSPVTSIAQIHALVGQATTQSNVSLTPSISQVGSFVAVSAQQTSLSSPASISQAQTISATQSNQATVASTASITQSHQISSQSVNQAQVSSTAPISLTQALTGVAANQSNIAPPVVIVQGNVSAAATGVQNNTTSLGTITQTQTLVGTSSQSTNVGSTATISQTIDLSAVAANQHAIGDSNTIWQAQFVQSQTVTQANSASVGAISAVPVIWLNAAISDQVSTSPAASITQDHNFAIIPGSSRNVSISGIIAQIHELYAIAANQATVSIDGQVAVIDYSQTPSIYTATSPLIRYSADSPQIVYQVFATK